MAITPKKPPVRAVKGAQPGSWVEGVEQVGHLGDGYLIVKVDSKTEVTLRTYTAPQARTGASPAGTPRAKQIPPRELHKLLRGLTIRSDPSVARAIDKDDGVAPRRKAPVRVTGASVMRDLRQHEAANRQRDIENGALVTSAELAGRLGVTTQSLSKAVQSKRMFTLDGASGRSMYPEFFADPRCDRAQIERVCQALGDLPGPSKWEFFTSPRVSLHGHTPVDALAKGELDLVLRAAAAFKER